MFHATTNRRIDVLLDFAGSNTFEYPDAMDACKREREVRVLQYFLIFFTVFNKINYLNNARPYRGPRRNWMRTSPAEHICRTDVAPAHLSVLFIDTSGFRHRPRKQCSSFQKYSFPEVK